MPLYEYFCSDCNTTFDALRPMKKSDQPIACKECEGDHTTRVLSLFFSHSQGQAKRSTGGSYGCGNDMCGCGHSHN